jgi:hypothetical protein
MKIQNDNLQDAAMKTIPRRRFYGRLSRKARLGIVGITLLAAGVLGAVALNHGVPRAPTRVKGVTGRLVWYVQDGRLKADMHTFASMCEYIVIGESDRSNPVVPTNLPIAANVLPTSPNS